MCDFEERRRPDIALSKVVDSLHAFFDQIEKNDIKFLYHGTYNVYEVKKKYIFRFPDIIFRNFKGIKLIQKEIKILNILKKYITFPIPDPIYISIDEENPFVGYEKIEGQSLSRCFKNATKSQKINVAKQIGTFLSQLHSERLYNVTSKELQVSYSPEQYKVEWIEYFENIKKNIFSLLNSIQRDWIIQLFTNFLKNEGNFYFKPTVIHGDFDTTNIIINPKTFDILGVIDFEDSRIYDPAADFLFYNEGIFFENGIISSYQGEMNSSFNERRKFLFGYNFLQYIKFGLEYHIPDMIRAGFRMLENKMRIIKF